MKKPTTFTERLEEALRLGGKDRQQLADTLGITIQAVSQLLLGKTKAMTAENCVRTARLTGVDSFWLATGSGEPRGDASGPQWPFRVTFEEYDRLSADQKRSLDIVVTEFVKATLAADRNDDWGEPAPRGVIAPSTPAATKRQKHG